MTPYERDSQRVAREKKERFWRFVLAVEILTVPYALFLLYWMLKIGLP